MLILVVAVLTLAAYHIPRALRVNIGSEQDRGLTHGFNDRERNPGFDFRWSSGESTVLLPSLAGETFTLTIGAAAPRPDGSAAHTDLLLDGHPLGVMTVASAYQVMRRWDPRGAFLVTVVAAIPRLLYLIAFRHPLDTTMESPQIAEAAL